MSPPSVLRLRAPRPAQRVTDGGDEALRLLEDREADVGGESGTEPEHAHLALAHALVTQPQFDHVLQQPRNRDRLDQLDLPVDELVERLAVDPILHVSSSLLVYTNPNEMRTTQRRPASAPEG